MSGQNFNYSLEIFPLVKLGGALIAPNVVLTSGRCADEMTDFGTGLREGSGVTIAADDLENRAANSESFSILNFSYIALGPQGPYPPEILALLQLNGSSAFQPIAMDDGTCTLNAGNATIIGEMVICLFCNRRG